MDIKVKNIDVNHLGYSILATDRQIDQLVYQLYGLTEEEIKIVEGDRIVTRLTTILL